MRDVLVWIYIINSTLLVVHEIDSAYWQEWKLFKLPGGLSFFLCLHLPLVFIILLGLLLVFQGLLAGLYISLILSLAGIFAFTIHVIFIRRGHHEFKIPVSIAILVSTLVVSAAQLIITLYVLAGR